MKIAISLLVMLVAVGISSAEWMSNPYTYKPDYYETNTPSADLAVETAARIAGDLAIGVSTAALAVSTGAIAVNLSTETAQRISSDTALGVLIATETIDRALGDYNIGVATAALGSNLTAESSSRSAADLSIGIATASLQSQISAVAATPTGSMILWTSSGACPSGYIYADGSDISTTTYAGLFGTFGHIYDTYTSSAVFKTADMRGYFSRGWDDAAGVDSGRVFGSVQQDEFKAHSHPSGAVTQIGMGGGDIYKANNNNNAPTGETGGAETRPMNIAFKYCIKY